jgi:hypothetical protein
MKHQITMLISQIKPLYRYGNTKKNDTLASNRTTNPHPLYLRRSVSFNVTFRTQHSTKLRLIHIGVHWHSEGNRTNWNFSTSVLEVYFFLVHSLNNLNSSRYHWKARLSQNNRITMCEIRAQRDFALFNDASIAKIMDICNARLITRFMEHRRNYIDKEEPKC